MSSLNDHLTPPITKPRMTSLDVRNTDLVSRLLAATPPYLYNMAILPNTYFFSELLRSFVQTKSETPQLPPSYTQNRRANSKKHPWTVVKAELSQKSTAEQPKNQTLPQEYESSSNKDQTKTPDFEIARAPFPSSSSSASASASAPPLWYPPIYPNLPYGIDPLHFCIDLRVSGHFYDRKTQQENPDKPNPFKHRHSSAFSVPIPNSDRAEQEPQNNQRVNIKYVSTLAESDCERKFNPTGINYVMKNIKSIYSFIGGVHRLDKSEADDDSNETEEARQKRVKDLRALIGLELVVDYMNHAKPGEKNCREGENHSPTLEVVALQDDRQEI